MSERINHSPEGEVLHVIPGISASGKTTLGRRLVQTLNKEIVTAKFVVPHTTRPKRDYEEDGIDYHFHSKENFENNFKQLCEDPESEWNASRINNYHYFNARSATMPSEEHSTSVLPVAFNTLPDVIGDHSERGYAISILPIAIGDHIKDKWLELAQKQRPTRNLERELETQDDFVHNYKGEVFYPDWELEQDANRYFRRAQALMTASKIAIRNFLEENNNE